MCLIYTCIYIYIYIYICTVACIHVLYVSWSLPCGLLFVCSFVLLDDIPN